VALMVLLMIGSIVFMPLVLPLIVTGLKADAWGIARPLLLLLLPLAAGFGLSRSAGAPLLLSLARRTSNLSFVLLVGLLVGLNLETMAGTLRTFAIPAAAIYVLGMAGIGHLLGGSDASKRIVSALCAGNRNLAVALVVAAASFEDPAITVMLLVTSITGLVLLLMITRLMRPTVAA
jgi:bile acid:Na+ symporter, BASS family